MSQWPNDNEVERISKKPYPWKRIDDFNPDAQPSHSDIHIEALGERVVGVLQVKGLGVLIFSALPPDFSDPGGKKEYASKGKASLRGLKKAAK